MPYVAKPDTDDVILSTFEERDSLSVTLFLREGEDGMGDEVSGWTDEDCAQAFEDGFLKRAPLGRLSDRDARLLESAFEYARDLGAPALVEFQNRVSAMVDATAEALPASYVEIDAADERDEDEEPEGRQERLVELAVKAAMKTMPYAKLSEARFTDVEEYLQANLAEALPKVEAGASPTP